MQSITEKADCWEVVLGFDPGMGALSSSGLMIEFKGLPATGWGSSHTVKVGEHDSYVSTTEGACVYLVLDSVLLWTVGHSCTEASPGLLHYGVSA